ncbi:hypothetical protein PGT21_012544 [Puccinia graminis f. sp. tritici]|uniref:Small ribosomal subunit protein bS18m n=2 Tax=Puccinia graminis f. sp. tritici TaxID=56615 RepID=E3K1Q3_PUCGT|nr:uncharacterized protein PGTG_04184 [Puccinia graminis f. sp. tritici CRL 75-36-700-3]EFP78228.2 hypothetical protein PGTG_04184 [Puccinia graminis f. sp. tritici CRL 75-36-700-3]KAA1096312.1 hypothetical protein PGT21_012560 [Puccinia graminis f. sp. tritici]KAA1112845.1 hypothetical protein PGT21_012544 [Puccinia graminis f. sp. tritici]KAA1132116.1 hypothetical protein PGTUg99_037226 [Puccinia graminis f. sp. tritici]
MNFNSCQKLWGTSTCISRSIGSAKNATTPLNAYSRTHFSSQATLHSENEQNKMTLSKLVEKEVKAKPLNPLPTFGSQWGKYFSDGSRRLSFNPNQVLKPSDLQLENLIHPADRESRKPRPVVRRPPTKDEVRLTDPFLYYNINILKEPYNPDLLANFITPLGRIKKRALTGLSKGNQKKVSKAIRRARCMGFLPYFGKPLERYSEDHQQRRDGPGVDLPPFAR